MLTDSGGWEPARFACHSFPYCALLVPLLLAGCSRSDNPRPTPSHELILEDSSESKFYRIEDPVDWETSRLGLPTRAIVAQVIDGDTLRLDNGEKVRLIGVDTPETVHPTKPVEFFGKEASAFTRRHLEGETILLKYDQANAATGHRDKYRRLLAYVFRERDGLDFNAELIRQGYAHAYTRFPFARMEKFRGYEREARESERGLWGGEISPARAPPGSTDEIDDPVVFVTRTGKKYHLAGCRYLSSSKNPVKLSEAKLKYLPCSVCAPQ